MSNFSKLHEIYVFYRITKRRKRKVVNGNVRGRMNERELGRWKGNGKGRENASFRMKGEEKRSERRKKIDKGCGRGKVQEIRTENGSVRDPIHIHGRKVDMIIRG